MIKGKLTQAKIFEEALRRKKEGTLLECDKFAVAKRGAGYYLIKVMRYQWTKARLENAIAFSNRQVAKREAREKRERLEVWGKGA